MGQVIKRLDVTAGRKYTTKNGEEKTHWINLGEAAEWDDGGISIRLHAVPTGNWFDGMLKLFPKREEGQQQGRAQQGQHQESRAPASRGDDFDSSEIPF